MAPGNNANAPIIVIGMHRSGTTMVVKLLEQLGVFFGSKQDVNSEALFFMRLNEWLMLHCGASWDNPCSVRTMFEAPSVLSMLTDQVGRVTASPLIINYLGLSRYLRYKGLSAIDMPWGWKDPRNTFLFPLWLNLFPDAKVIHIFRNGVDVANSLKVRMERLVNAGRLQSWWQDALYNRLPRRARTAFSPRCYTLDGGFSLWEEYMAAARKNIDETGVKALEIRYETFLSDPAGHLGVIADFCGVGADVGRIDKLVNRVRKDRAYAYRLNPELNGFAESVKSKLSAYGYCDGIR